MKTKQVRFGSRVGARVLEVFPSREGGALSPAGAMLVGEDKEAYVIFGVTHSVELVKGEAVTLEFVRGGPYGGYWKAVEKQGEAV